MLDAPVLPPPAIVAPAPREASFGRVAGTAPEGTRRVIVRVGERVLADRRLRGRRFTLTVELPPREVTVRVTAVDSVGRRASGTVAHVYGLQPGAAPRAVRARLDPVLAQEIRTLVGGFRGTSAVYLQDLRTGRGAAWNAAARFPAASTLKLAIAVAVLGRHDGKPSAGSRLHLLLRRMLVESHNESANDLEVWLGGSTGAGSGIVNETMWKLGLTDSLMYGGYLPSPFRKLAGVTPIPIRVEGQPSFGQGKYTSAADLARLFQAVFLAAGGKGPLPQLGVSPSEARHLLWLLAAVGDRGKLGRSLVGPVTLLHKGGWLATSRHDAGLVLWPGGAFVAAVMTWSPGGLGSSADVLAGEIAALGRRRFG